MNLLKILCLTCIAALLSFCSSAQCIPNVSHDSLRLIPNAAITATAQSGNILYMAGDFWVTGRYTGPFIGVDINTSKPVYDSWPMVRGIVNRILPDGNGGWYIGGKFRRVGDSTRHGLAHIDAGGNVLPLSTGMVYYQGVNDMLIKDSILYVAGNFDFFMGDSLSCVAAINRNTDQLIGSWQPKVNNEVFTIAENDGLIYLGGSFTMVDTLQRSRLAAVDAITGQPTAWNPNVGSNYPKIYDIEILNDRIFVGGDFTIISGIARDGLAELSPITGAPTNWHPPLGGYIRQLTARDGHLYLAGAIDTAQYYTRSMLLKIDTSLAADIDTIMNFERGGVGAFCMAGDTIYASGFYHYMPGKRRMYLLAWSLSGDSVTSWECNPGGAPLDMCVQNGRLYMAGDFYNVGKITKGIAAIDMNADTVLNWFPTVENTYNGTHKQVRQLLLDGNKLFLAGQFDSVNSERRRSLAAIDRISGELLPWRPRLSGTNFTDIDSSVNEIALSGNSIYLGGRFNKVNNIVRKGLAAVDTSTGLTTLPWNPHTYAQVQNVNISAVYAHDTSIYVGGQFYDIANTQRHNIVKLGRTTGAADPNWHPDVLSSYTWTNAYTGTVKEIKIDGPYMYIAGYFQYVDSQQRNGIAKLRLADGAVMPWQGDQFNIPYSWADYKPNVHFIGNSLYLAHDSFAVIDKVTGANGFTTSFGTNNNRKFITANSYNGKVYLGGYFTNLTTPQFNTSEIVMHHLLYFNIGYPPTTTVYSTNPVCENTSTSFAAVTQVTNPTYQWQVNDTNVNANSALFTYIPQDGDLVSCIVSDTSANCFFSPVVSAETEMNVVPANTTPTATLSGPDTVCAGNFATYIANTNVYGGTYQWLVNGINTGSSSSYYTFFPQNGDSIKAIITTPPLNCYTNNTANTDMIEVAVVPVIVPDISLSPGVVSNTGEVIWIFATVNNAPNGYSIAWFNHGNLFDVTSGNIVTYIKGTGTDSIIAVVTPNGPCYQTDTSAAYINYNATAVAFHGQGEGVMVYPNPCADQLVVSGLNRGDEVSLYDLTGRQLQHQPAKETKLELEMNGLPPGTYILRVVAPEGEIKKAGVIQKK